MVRILDPHGAHDDPACGIGTRILSLLRLPRREAFQELPVKRKKGKPRHSVDDQQRVSRDLNPSRSGSAVARIPGPLSLLAEPPQEHPGTTGNTLTAKSFSSRTWICFRLVDGKAPSRKRSRAFSDAAALPMDSSFFRERIFPSKSGTLRISDNRNPIFLADRSPPRRDLLRKAKSRHYAYESCR